MDRSKVLQIIGLVTVSVLSVAAVIYDRPCPTDVEVAEGFSLDRYLGRWYEIERYEQDWNTNYDCVQAVYGLTDDSIISVTNLAYNLLNDTTKVQIGTAKLSFPDEEIVQGKLNVSFFDKPNDRSNYWIVDTDYENYSIVWSCEPLPNETSREGFGLLSRTRQFTDDEQINEKVNHFIEKYIDLEQVTITNQSDERCPDFEEIKSFPMGLK